MKILILISSCLGLVFQTVAQTTITTFADSSYSQNRILFSGNIDLTGTSMRKEFINTLLFGGTIDEAMKNRTLKSHRAINREGVYGSGEISYVAGASSFGKSGKYTWLVKGGYYAVGNMNYSKDAYRLVFYGNQHLENDSAKLSGLRVKGTQFQKIGFGMFHKKTGSSLTLNLVNVQNTYAALLRNGIWAQDQTGENVYATLKGEATLSQGKQFSKGLGFSLDFESNFKVPWGKDSTIIQLAIHNLGAAYMFVPQTHFSVDTSYHYSGFSMNQIKNSSNLFGGDFSILDTLNISRTEKKHWIMLPAHIQVMKQVNLTSAKKLQTFFGIRFYPTLGVVPTGFVGLYYRFIPQFSAAVNASYGGSSIFRAGLSLAYHGEKIGVQLGTDDFYGLVSKKGFGQSVLIRLSWKF